jgi:hypothetical protein
VHGMNLKGDSGFDEKVARVAARCQRPDETHLNRPRNGLRASARTAREARWAGARWIMDGGLSMSARVEITRKYARDYARASKGAKGKVLDQVCAVTGWSRDNARRRLVSAASSVRRIDGRRQRGLKYSTAAQQVLARLWGFSGGQCGKYLVVSLPQLVEALEAHGELVTGHGGYTQEVRAELLSMSAATIDRYLAPARAKDHLHGLSTTRPAALLRSSITVRKAGDEVEELPGFFECDTVAHCGPTTRGEYARSLNMTDVRTGWVHTVAIRNNARVWVLGALEAAVVAVPFTITGLDFDNGSEFINHDLVAWAADRSIFFTRSRPYRKNDQATIESKNNHLVRRYAFHYRYDTPEELALLARLWPLVDDRLNYLTPTKKPTGWSADQHGRRKRIYDAPRTPLERLLTAGVLSPAQQAELTAYRDALNPAELARNIARCQAQLIGLARDKTDQLRARLPSAEPDHSGIRTG